MLVVLNNFIKNLLITKSNNYERQHICYSAYMLRQFRPSVCLSVTRVHCIQTAEHIIEILYYSDRSIILVFSDQGFLRKSDGFTPNGGTEHSMYERSVSGRFPAHRSRLKHIFVTPALRSAPAPRPPVYRSAPAHPIFRYPHMHIQLPISHF